MMNPLLAQHSAQWVEQWLKILSDLGRASSTISAYRQALNHYLAHCYLHNIQPESVSFEHIATYIRPQLPGMEHPVASATLQLRITAIRLWYDFLLYHHICETNPVPRATSSSPIFVGRGLIPRLIKLPIIPNDIEWFHFLKLTATAPLFKIDGNCTTARPINACIGILWSIKASRSNFITHRGYGFGTSLN